MFVSYVLRTVHAKYFGTRDAWAPITTRRIAVGFFLILFTFGLIIKKTSARFHGRRQGGAREVHLHPPGI